MTSRSPTITNPDWLENEHAGQMLVAEFMEPIGLSVPVLAAALGVAESHLNDVVSGKKSVDAELDLRLARYFGMSEGFFLRLQNRHDLLEAKRALNGDLDRIIPRAA